MLSLVYSYLVDDGIAGETSREQAREAVEQWLGNQRSDFSPPGFAGTSVASETWGMLPEHQAGMERAMNMSEGYSPS